MNNLIDINLCASYATEANLDRALARLGLDDYKQEPHEMACRYIKCRNDKGRWTAIFLASQYFTVNKTGGYVCFASQHGFMSI